MLNSLRGNQCQRVCLATSRDLTLITSNSSFNVTIIHLHASLDTIQWAYVTIFHFPRSTDIDPNKEILYFTGNSLGLQPKTARALVNAELDKWQHKLVEWLLNELLSHDPPRAIAGHFEGEYPWYYMEQFVIEESARIVGQYSKGPSN